MASEVVRVRLGDEDLGSFDFQKMTVFDSIQLKAKSGLTMKQFVDGLSEMDGTAMQALVWLLRVRKGEVTDLHAINFAIGDLALEEEPDPTQETSGSDAADTSVSSPTSAT
jgi:hypothetical protein